jgi:hypothetical protein
MMGGVIYIADQWCAVSMTPLININTADQGAPAVARLLFSLKGISIKKIIHRQIVQHVIYNIR